MIKTYLRVTMMVMDHMMTDKAWTISSWLGGSTKVDENT